MYGIPSVARHVVCLTRMTMSKRARERPVADLLYVGREAELILAYRRSLAMNNGADVEAIGFARGRTDEKFASKDVDTCQGDAIFSSSWDTTSADV